MLIKKIFQSSGIVAKVVNVLTSTSTVDALSANQGKVLNDKVTAIGAMLNYILTPKTTALPASTWSDMAITYTTGTLEAGKYLIFCDYTLTGAAGGNVTTSRIFLDGAELTPQQRLTIPLQTATMSGKIVSFVEFSTTATHTINAQTWPTAQIASGTQLISFTFIRIQ